MFNLKNEFLTEVTHAPLGILGAFAGWARWLELRLPDAGRPAGWLWIACFTAVGLLLLVYREACHVDRACTRSEGNPGGLPLHVTPGDRRIMAAMIAGQATAEGTARYAARFADLAGRALP